DRLQGTHPMRGTSWLGASSKGSCDNPVPRLPCLESEFEGHDCLLGTVAPPHPERNVRGVGKIAPERTSDVRLAPDERGLRSWATAARALRFRLARRNARSIAVTDASRPARDHDSCRSNEGLTDVRQQGFAPCE